MKIVYIAHSISGDIKANLTDLRRIVRHINLTKPDIVPFVPYYIDVVSLDDNTPYERMRGIANDAVILASGIVDELWLTGEIVSPGMEDECELCYRLNIPVIDKLNLL